MKTSEKLLFATSELHVAHVVGRHHDEARMRYPVGDGVSDFPGWIKEIGKYQAYHFTTCSAPGAKMLEFEACERAKQIIAEEYKSQGLTLANACDDAVNCTNGGIRHHLDLICDSHKNQSIGLYKEHVFDTLVSPTDWDAKVEVIRDLLAYFQPVLAQNGNSAVKPEQFAHDYKRFVRVIVDAQRRVELQARRL